MPKPKTWLRLVVIVLAVAALAYASWHFTRPKPPEVELATIARGTVEATVVNTRAGTVKACRRARLAPVSGGQIVRLWVKEGERVKAGQPLLELWNRDLAAQRELAIRQLTTSEERRREACISQRTARRRPQRAAGGQGFRQPAEHRGRPRQRPRTPGQLRRARRRRQACAGADPRHAGRAGAHHAHRAVCRRRRENHRRGRRIHHPLAARHPPPACRGFDRRQLPVHERADGRGRRAQAQARPARAHHP